MHRLDGLLQAEPPAVPDEGWLCTVAGKEDKQAQARAMAADLVVALQTTMNQQVRKKGRTLLAAMSPITLPSWNTLRRNANVGAWSFSNAH